MGVGGDQLDPTQTAGDQVAEQDQPVRSILGRGDVQAETALTEMRVAGASVV